MGCVARCQIPISSLGSCTRSGNVLMNTPTMFSMPATSGGIRSWAVAHALTGQPIVPGLVHRTVPSYSSSSSIRRSRREAESASIAELASRRLARKLGN